MAEGFNTGIRGPQVAPNIIATPTVFQEGAVSGRNMDWTLQEDTLFKALATSVAPAIDKWKALDAEAQKLKADKVEFEYRTTLDEYNAFVETTTNKEMWSRIIGTAPPSGRRRTWLPGFDDNENTPEIPSGVLPKTPTDAAPENYGSPRIVPTPSSLEADRENNYKNHVGYASSENYLINVSAQNEALKSQAYTEAVEGGATEEQLRELMEDWYKPGGGLSRAVYSDTHGWNPAIWETE